jgi:hypothetical protein
VSIFQIVFRNLDSIQRNGAFAPLWAALLLFRRRREWHNYAEAASLGSSSAMTGRTGRVQVTVVP